MLWVRTETMNSCLPVSCRPDDHRGAFPNFRQPTIIGYFSLDNQRQFRNDLSGKFHDLIHFVEHEFKKWMEKVIWKLKLFILGLQYLVAEESKDVHLDLDHNVRKARKALPAKNEENISNLLKGILANKSKFVVNGAEEVKSLHTDIVCFRGLLTTIMCSPYERRDDWMVDVVRHWSIFWAEKIISVAIL